MTQMKMLVYEDETSEDLLVDWGFQKYVNSFKTNGLDKIDSWNKLNVEMLKELTGMKRTEARKFLRLKDAYLLKFKV